MSTTYRVLSVVAVLLSSVSATVTNPTQNAVWSLNTNHQIQWDTAGLQEPLQLHLAPGGSSDISASIATLAPSIPNAGAWTWYPTTSIPQHSSYTIIIIDAGGHHQASPPFQMIGWPQQPIHHTPIVHQPPVHTPPAHVVPPVHTIAPLQPSAVVITSLHVAPIVHTSQLAPIIKTIESPPLIQTENVAPIVLTQTQEPVTKIVTKPDIITTEYLQPIVKTILVTETPAPIIKTIVQEPHTVIETLAPVILTETRAPIIKTVSQAPQIVTEEIAPVLVTSHVTQTLHLTSFAHPSLPPVHTPILVHTPVVVHTPAVVYPAPGHTTLVSVHGSAPVAQRSPGLVQSVEPLFPNVTTTSIDIPTFSTPLALAATDPSAAASSGAGGLQGSFTGAASRSSVAFGGLFGGLITLVALFI